MELASDRFAVREPAPVDSARDWARAATAVADSVPPLQTDVARL